MNTKYMKYYLGQAPFAIIIEILFIEVSK